MVQMGHFHSNLGGIASFVDGTHERDPHRRAAKAVNSRFKACTNGW
jgi:hypothetical protein